MTLAMMIHVRLDFIQELECVRDYILLFIVKERLHVKCDIHYSN